MLEKTLEGLLDFKEIQPVNPQGNQFWIFIARTDAEAETPILWPPDVKNQLIGKDWERLKVGGEGDNRGWDSWMALPTQWTWVCVNSRSWWWTGRPAHPWTAVHGVAKNQTWLSDWTELHWTEVNWREPSGTLMGYRHQCWKVIPRKGCVQGRERLWNQQLTTATCSNSKELKHQEKWGTPLVVQWLRICLPMQGTQVRFLVRELRSHRPRSS